MLPLRSIVRLVLAAGLASMALSAVAGDKPRHRERPQDADVDQNEALARLRSSEFKPLAEVLAAAAKVIPGEVVRIKVKSVRGRLAYELKIVTAQGRVREVYVDPVNLDIVKVE